MSGPVDRCVLLSTNVPSTVATKTIARSPAASLEIPALVRLRPRGVDPRVERGLGRFSEGFARVGDLPGDRSDGARIDEVAFLEDGSGSVEEVRVRRRWAVGIGGDRSNNSRYTAPVASMTATASASLPPGKKW